MTRWAHPFGSPDRRSHLVALVGAPHPFISPRASAFLFFGVAALEVLRVIRCVRVCECVRTRARVTMRACVRACGGAHGRASCLRGVDEVCARCVVVGSAVLSGIVADGSRVAAACAVGSTVAHGIPSVGRSGKSGTEHCVALTPLDASRCIYESYLALSWLTNIGVLMCTSIATRTHTVRCVPGGRASLSLGSEREARR